MIDHSKWRYPLTHLPAQPEFTTFATMGLLQAVFRDAPFTIMVLDEQARVIQTNLPFPAPAPNGDEAELNLHWLCGQLLHCTHLDREGALCGAESECRDCPIRNAIGEVITSGTGVRDREISMTLRCGANVELRHLALSVSPLQGTDSRTFLLTLNDITARVLAEQQRLELERQLLHTQKLESLGILAGSVAHDFNNLLMAMLGHLDLANEFTAADSPSRTHLARAKSATRHAADLTRQLLVYAGRGRLQRVPVDLASLVADNLDLLRVSIGKTVELQLRIADQLPPISADPGQLQQLVMNLITNASDAIGPNPGTITLTLREETLTADDLDNDLRTPLPAGRYLALQVRDTGCGMDEATRQRIFDPFFTTKQSGQGLGMSSLLGIVRVMHGAIVIDSAPGAGTTIRLLFPTIIPSDSVQTETPDLDLQNLEKRRFYGTLLIVDDEEMVRLITAEYAQMFGFEVMTASNGEEGVRLFCQQADRIDCVLLDLTMPVMDGLETFRRIRQIRPEIPVILASGYIEVEATERFFGEGLSAFIQKPYDKNDLRRKLAEVFRST